MTLLFSSLAERLTRPLVRLGDRLYGSAEAGGGAGRSLVLGIATGLLWTPCAGPILGLILTGAALSGASARTAILLLAYAAGAATSLTVALLAGGRVFRAMKRSLGAEVWVRRILGVAVLAGVAAVAFGLDRGILTRLSLAGTSNLEQRLVEIAAPMKQQDQAMKSDDKPAMMMMSAGGDSADVPQTLPDLSGATEWINSQPLTAESLRGKVVVIDFWTYSCINCLRSLPYINAWYGKYKDSGLVVIGVHTPEFPFEKDEANVRKAVRELGIEYPVAMDNDYRIWRGFNNQLLARALLHRCGGAGAFSPLRRRRLRTVRSVDSQPAGRAEPPAAAGNDSKNSCHRRGGCVGFAGPCNRRRLISDTFAPRTLPRPAASSRMRRNSIARPPS